MKKIVLSLIFIAIATIGFAQNIVTTIPQYSSAVLEEYTGIHCQYCPDGHKIAKEIKADYPNRVVLINVHTGGYAVPSGSDPDFRTTYGSALAAQTGLLGYPSGTINRQVFPQFNSAMALDRGQWRLAAEQVMNTPSAVNIGATTTYNPTTREVTINVEAYYNFNAAHNYNLLNIALVQDSIPGPQTGASTWNPADVLPNGKYLHAHMLRDLVTGQWGDTISNTTQGSLFAKTYTYTLPNNVNGVTVNPDHCHLAIFITETKATIMQGIVLGIDGAMNSGDNARFYGNFQNADKLVQEGAASGAKNFSFDFQSSLTGAHDYIFKVETDQPSDWSYQLKVNNVAHNSGDTISVSSAENLGLEVTPGTSPALAGYTIYAYPVNDTTTKTELKLHVISGITDLIVDGSGGWGDGGVYNWDQKYLHGLASTGINTYALTKAKVFEEASHDSALNSVNNIYMNIGWTFPSLSDNQAQALMNFMDHGGNLFIAGQDIGWDIRSGSGSGDAVTKNLYQNYLKADFQSDGNTQNNQLTAVSTDNVYGNVPGSAIIDVYNGNFFPDEIIPQTGAMPVFYYSNDSNKVAGIRYYSGTYKTVYLGVGPEMLQDSSVANAILDLSYQWFTGMVSIQEFDLVTKGVSIYPNPSSGNTSLVFPDRGDYEVNLINATGALVKTYQAQNVAGMDLHLGNLPTGMYFLQVKTGEKSITRKIMLN